MPGNDEAPLQVVVDPRLAHHEEPAAVVRIGAESIASQKYKSTANSTSQHTYTVTPPSVQVVVDRAMYWHSDVLVQFDIALPWYDATSPYGYIQDQLTGEKQSIAQALASRKAQFTAANYVANGAVVPAGSPGAMPADASIISDLIGGDEFVAYGSQGIPEFGKNWSLAAYPLNRLTTSQSLTVNDVSLQVPTGQILPQLLRMHDGPIARAAAGTTPTQLDIFAETTNGYRSATNPYGDASRNASKDGGQMPNGSFANWCYTDASGNPLVNTNPEGGVFYDSDGNTHAYNQAGVPCYTWTGTPPAGSTAAPVFKTVISAGNTVTVWVKLSLTEPIFISPLAHGLEFAEQEQGLFGIQSIGFTTQMQSPADARIIRQVNGNINLTNIKYFSKGGNGGDTFMDSYLQATFLTPPVSLPLDAKSKNRYHSVQNFQFPGGQITSANKTMKLSIGALPLQSCPDMIMIYVTPSATDDATYYGPTGLARAGDFCFPIDSVSVSYSNKTGMLSNHSDYQLWKMTNDNGYKMSYQQWSGLMNTEWMNLATAVTSQVPTSGGALVLKFAKDIATFLTDAPGLPGSNVFGIDVTVKNPFQYGGYTANSGQGFNTRSFSPVVNVVVINSGFFTANWGHSAHTVTPLTESAIVEAAANAATHGISEHVVGQLSGGGITSNLTTAWNKGKKFYGKVAPVLAGIKRAADASGIEPFQKVGRVMGSLGISGKGRGGGVQAGSGAPHFALSSRYEDEEY